MEWEVVTSVWYKVDILGWRMSPFLLGWSGTTQNGLMCLGTMNKDLWITNFWKLQLWLDIGNWTLESSMDKGKIFVTRQGWGTWLSHVLLFPYTDRQSSWLRATESPSGQSPSDSCLHPHWFLKYPTAFGVIHLMMVHKLYQDPEFEYIMATWILQLEYVQNQIWISPSQNFYFLTWSFSILSTVIFSRADSTEFFFTQHLARHKRKHTWVLHIQVNIVILRELQKENPALKLHQGALMMNATPPSDSSQ